MWEEKKKEHIKDLYPIVIETNFLLLMEEKISFETFTDSLN
jgi:hypothetical protein